MPFFLGLMLLVGIVVLAYGAWRLGSSAPSAVAKTRGSGRKPEALHLSEEVLNLRAALAEAQVQIGKQQAVLNNAEAAFAAGTEHLQATMQARIQELMQPLQEQVQTLQTQRDAMARELTQQVEQSTAAQMFAAKQIEQLQATLALTQTQLQHSQQALRRAERQAKAVEAAQRMLNRNSANLGKRLYESSKGVHPMISTLGRGLQINEPKQRLGASKLPPSLKTSVPVPVPLPFTEKKEFVQRSHSKATVTSVPAEHQPISKGVMDLQLQARAKIQAHIQRIEPRLTLRRHTPLAAIGGAVARIHLKQNLVVGNPAPLSTSPEIRRLSGKGKNAPAIRPSKISARMRTIKR
jgi:hypothetical protein